MASAASAASPVNLGPVVSAIICKTTSGVNKFKAYNQFTIYLKESSGDSFDNVVLEIKHQLREIVASMNKDIGDDDPQVAQAALQCLGLILRQKDITHALNSAQTLSIIDTLCQTIINTTDNYTCTRALWCLAEQDMSKSIIENELEKILEAIEYGQCKKNMQSMTVEYEALNATIRLLEHVPVAMKPHTLRWGKLVYPLLVHEAPRLRERAMVAMETGMSAMLEHQEELVKLVIPDLKSLLIQEMSKLMVDKKENEVFVLKVWRCYVKILGKSLHHGVLINSLLPIVETGFKNVKEDVMIEAYKCWQALIDNFAESADIVSNYKRVKLIMQVFRVSNAKYESVAIEKLRVWWHFLNKLGEKNSQYFEMVCVPLLEYAIKGVITGNSFTPAPKTPLQRMVSGGFTSPPGQSTPKINPTTPGGSKPIVFPAVQKLGAQVIALVLGKSMNSPELPKARFTLEPLSHDIISSGTFFIKHSTVFINAVKQCIMDLGEQIQDGILYHLWYNLVALIKNAIESNHKKDGAEASKLFLESLGDIVQAQSLQPGTILKLIQAVICLPQKVLASSTYHVSGASSDVMQVSLVYQGCPAVYLVGILCHHRLIETCGANERFFTILEKLIVVGLNSSASLEFCQSCLQHVEKAAPQADSRECVWRMWSMITNPLHSHLLKTKEVNQSNTLEHDFSCLYIALHLPIKHVISSTLPQPTLKTVLRSWRDLYSTFSRLTALVTNAEANVGCEKLCARIVSGISSSGVAQLEDVVFVEFMSHMCQFMVTAIDYSGFSNMSILHSISPSSFSKKEAQPLGNLTSLVELCNKLMAAILEHHVSMQKSSGAQRAVVCLVGVTETLYNHLPTSGLLAALTASLGPTLARLMGSNNSKIFTPHIASKFEALWLSIVISLELRYTAPFDSDMLRIMSPLLEVTFLHPKRAIKNQTLILWNSTFGRSAPLKYPDSLKSVLAAVKEKSLLQLPGWDSAEVVMVAPARDRQMTQGGESQISTPNITGLKSPVKTIGSFLNRDVSPNVKKSLLLKTPSKSSRATGTPSNAKKNLSLNSLDLMKKDDFVVIPAVPPKRGRRVFTEHQKDVMREHRREGPGVAALYTAVEVSMDGAGASLMGFSDTQMTEASCSDTLDTPQIEITPFPFFPKLLKDEAKEIEMVMNVVEVEKCDKSGKLTTKRMLPGGGDPGAGGAGGESAAATLSAKLRDDVPWVCAFCHHSSNHAGMGDLFGPYYPQDKYIHNQRSTDATGVLPSELWVHEDCAVWANGVYMAAGGLCGLEDAVMAANNKRCTVCGSAGASLGCLHTGCQQNFHFHCATEDGVCLLDEENFSVLCPKHKDKKPKVNVTTVAAMATTNEGDKG